MQFLPNRLTIKNKRNGTVLYLNGKRIKHMCGYQLQSSDGNSTSYLIVRIQLFGKIKVISECGQIVTQNQVTKQ